MFAEKISKAGTIFCAFMFKCVHDARNYLRNDVIMHVDIFGAYTKSSEEINLYVPRVIKEKYKKLHV